MNTPDSQPTPEDEHTLSGLRTLGSAPPTAPKPSNPRSTTTQFTQQGAVTFSSLFREPAQESRRRHESEGRSCDQVVARLLLNTWRAFFSTFREDEKEREMPRFEQEAREINRAVKLLGPLDTPDLTTCRQMLYLLGKFLPERVEGHHQRIDILGEHIRKLEQQQNNLRLSNCVTQDEQKLAKQKMQRKLVRLGHDQEAIAAASVPELVDMLIQYTDSEASVAATPATMAKPPEPAPVQAMSDANSSTFRSAVQAIIEQQDMPDTQALGEGERALLDQLQTQCADHDTYRGILRQTGLLP